MSRKRTDRRMVWICGGQFVCQKSGCTAFFEKGAGAARKALSAFGKNSRGGLWGPNVAEMERFELEGAFFTANDSLIKYGFIAYLFKSSIF